MTVEQIVHLSQSHDTPFFPAEEGGVVRIFARSSVVSLVVDVSNAPLESLAMLGVVYATRNVAVYLRNGKVVTGALTSLSGLSRTLDLVNHPPKSFAIRAGTKIHHQRRHFQEHLEVDFAYTLGTGARFRVNAFMHDRGEGAVFRQIPEKIPRFEDSSRSGSCRRSRDPEFTAEVHSRSAPTLQIIYRPQKQVGHRTVLASSTTNR